MTRAPHKVHTVFVADGKFVPAGVENKVLRAEDFVVGENRKITLTLSDFYADEYNVAMGPDAPHMVAFCQRITADKSFCRIKARAVVRKDGTNFSMPVVHVVNAETGAKEFATL